MNENRLIPLRQKGEIDDPLTEILRAGARRLIAQAVEAEFESFLASTADLNRSFGGSRRCRDFFGFHQRGADMGLSTRAKEGVRMISWRPPNDSAASNRFRLFRWKEPSNFAALQLISWRRTDHSVESVEQPCFRIDEDLAFHDPDKLAVQQVMRSLPRVAL